MGSDAHRRPIYYGALLHYDPFGIRQILQAIFIYSYCSCSSGSFAGEPSQSIGKAFLKGYAAVCLEGAIIILACVIFSVFASSPPVVDTNVNCNDGMVLHRELIFNMLVLVGAAKKETVLYGDDGIVRMRIVR